MTPRDSTISIDALLARALHHAETYLRELDDRPVAPRVGPDELRAAFAVPLPENGVDPEQVLDELVAASDPGLLNSGSGRFFGWVMGGTLPAALAADWMTSVWDQNAPIYATSPSASIAEEVTGTWLKDLLRLPAGASFALVTGSQMAHVTCLAAARHRLLADRGVDVEEDGLAGAPAIRVVASELRHETIVRALRFLGIGSSAIRPVSAEPSGHIRLDDFRAALAEAPDAPTMVCLLAGELNTGAFDPFAEACELAHESGAWVHVDGAFGLWAAASDRRRHLLSGVELADSWATDGHKTLNTPYDSGYAFVADTEAHRGSMTIEASYALKAGDGRSETDWTPEWSRRARAFATYAALRSLGRRGVEELVDRMCDHAARLVAGIGELPGAEVVAAPVVNQGLVRFRDPAGEDDLYTDRVAERVRDSGEAWFGPVTWQGRRCMRVSVSSWRTTAEDVDRAVAAVARALAPA